jgi:hypothetical protein
MESNRQEHRVNRVTRHRQRGITVLGFLILAVLFGAVGLAGIKITPMYINNMRLSRVMEDAAQELSGKGSNPGLIRQDIYNRLSIEDINLPTENLKITQSTNGYTVRVQVENRAAYVADVWLLVLFDKQVEIRR